MNEYVDIKFQTRIVMLLMQKLVYTVIFKRSVATGNYLCVRWSLTGTIYGNWQINSDRSNVLYIFKTSLLVFQLKNYQSVNEHIDSFKNSLILDLLLIFFVNSAWNLSDMYIKLFRDFNNLWDSTRIYKSKISSNHCSVLQRWIQQELRLKHHP